MSSFSKFGVHPAPGVGGILQPKMMYRFKVAFFGFGTAGSNTVKLVQNVQKCSKPSLTHEIAEVHSYNSRINLLGKHKWGDITISFRDDITNGVVALIGQQLQKQFNHFEQTSAISGNDYKFRMEIHAMDGTHGAPLEMWNVEGCLVKDFKYGQGDYTSGNGIVEIELVIAPDNCTQIVGSNENVVVAGGELFPDVGPTAGNLGTGSGGFSD